MEEYTESSENVDAPSAFEILGQFLEEDGWHPHQLEGRTIYRMGFAGDSAYTTCFAQIIEEQDILIFYVVAPVKVPEGKRPDLAEFITRANYGLHIGNLEMDYADGEVRYKSSLDFEGTALEPRLIRNAIYPAVRTMDRYLPGALSIIYGSKSPAQAVEDVEASPV